MSQFHLTPKERVEALLRFGYTEREAAFLCIAALHGGYFLRSQYARFLGKDSSEEAIAELIEKVFINCHATAIAFDKDVHLYHLCARPFYAAIGEVDNRNRRLRECSTIKNKVMALDFGLAYPECAFLLTEQERVQHFTTILGIAPSQLPSKSYGSATANTTRYFVEKYPIFLAKDGVPSFCFVDEGLTTPSHFKTFLAAYGPLFAALSEFNVIYVAANRRPVQWAETTFKKQLAKGGQSALATADWKRLAAYFTLRQQYESKDVHALDRGKLIQLRNEQMALVGEGNDRLFETWKTGGDVAIKQLLTRESSGQMTAAASFSTYILEHNYDYFGSLTSL